jgi:hypothetical protein
VTLRTNSKLHANRCVSKVRIALGEHDPWLRAVGHKYDSLSFPHFETMIVSVAGAPCPKNRLVGMAIGNETGRAASKPMRR